MTGAGDEDGGSLTLVDELATGFTLRIDRDTSRTQESNWGRNDPFPAVASETAHVHLKGRSEVLPVSRSYLHLFKQM